jgi:nitrate reductase NapE component
MERAFLIAPILIVLAVLAGSAQSDPSGLRSKIEARFEMLPIANGVVLTPRFKTLVRSIELSDSRIAIDGTPVTGVELRERLGSDADLVLQLSYLEPDVRRLLARGETPPTPKPAEPSPSTIEPETPAEPVTPRARRREDVVRIGGGVTISSDESVRGDVVAIGGSASVDGEVDGEVVVVGGSARLGPNADVRGDVTVVGGGLYRDPKSRIRGEVHEIGIGGLPWQGEWSRQGNWGWMDGFYPVARLTGTLVRITLLVLLTAVVLFVARTSVEQIADRVADDPVKSWFVGFLAEMLFFPVLVLTVVVLAISIIGIPLLVLVPVAIVAAILAMLVGFTGVAFHFGRLIQQRIEGLRGRDYVATFLGIVLIVSPVLIARLVGLIDGFGIIVWSIAAVAFLLEYMVWTAGLGAAALVRFSRPAPPPVIINPPVAT